MKPSLSAPGAAALPRRHFLGATAAAAGVALAFPPVLRAAAPGRRIRVAVMGLHRGEAHLDGFMAQPGVEVAAVCDVDRRALAAGAKRVEAKTGRAPRTAVDFRRLLEDPEIDALSIAAPNHWHAPATLLACAAGKHVYVEKPGSHNLHEADLMVEAARHHRRLVQMGNQRRSWPHVREAMERLHSGAIGRVRFARSWYAADRQGIGSGKPAPVPDWLDYSLWQGPAPERPYLDNVVHYNWHWRWHWGGGELANNGPHALDLVRWGLGVACPRRVATVGARYHFQDDQETPDTTLVTYDFGTCAATWEAHSCHPRGLHGTGFGVEFQGEGGTLLLLDRAWTQLDLKNKPLAEGPGQADAHRHFANFVAAIRGEAALNSEIAEGQASTRLCHYGNVAWRTGHSLEIDPATGRIRNDPAARRLWGREYRKGWTPRV